MIDGNPMTFRSQLGLALVGVSGVLMILWLLRKRRINEGLFYLWLIVFSGILVVGVSHRIQVVLATLVGTYSAVSTMLLLALGFLFGASLVYSVLLSNNAARIRDLTTYVAEIRLDVDDLIAAGRRAEGGEGPPPREADRP